MIVLRSLLFQVIYVLSTIVFSIISLGLWLTPKATAYHVMTYWARFVLWNLRVICKLSYRVQGAVQLDQPAVALVRHESAWETLALQEIFPRQAWVLKRELLRIPFFGWGLAVMWPIAIDRGAGRAALKQVIEQGKERLADGAWVVIFPEGTRMPADQLGKMNIGGAMLAEKSGSPVVLMTHNAGRYWAKGAFLKYPGVIEVYISDPLPAGLSATEINQRAEAFFRQHGQFSSSLITENNKGE
jgi:1-acyl-sn-glycerol-3-phosphate acyltransferase